MATADVDDDILTMNSELHSELDRIWCHTGEDRRSLRLVLVGKTGSGKSETGNTILGEHFFKTLFGASSVTATCQKKRAKRFGKDIVLIDTPGMFDTRKPNTQIMKEVARCVGLSLPGPHAFLLVIRAGRFTPEENDTVKHLENCFGEDMFKHTLLVFTGRDELEKKNLSFQEYLETVPPSLQEIVEKCNRYIVIDNTSDRSDKDTEKVMEAVNALVEEHGGHYYTNEMYQTVVRECREREEEVRRQNDKEKQKEKEEIIQQLEKKYQDRVGGLETERNRAEKRIKDLKKERKIMEENLLERKMKDERFNAMERELERVKGEVKKYRKQADDAKHQREICLQDRDKSIQERHMALDEKYDDDFNVDSLMLSLDTVAKVVGGVLIVGWNILNLFTLFKKK